MRKTIYIILIIPFFITSQLFSQDKFNLGFGAGYTDLINVGLYYQIDQVQIGISSGTWPNEKLLSLIGDIKFHFGDKSELSALQLWYFSIGLNFLYEDSRTKIFRSLHGNFRVGRKVFFSRKIGLDLNLGLIGRISEYNIIKIKQYGPIGGVDIPFLPCASLKIFYRI